MNRTSNEHALHYLNTLIETSSDAIIIINKLGVVEFWSTKAEEMYGIPVERIQNKKISTFFKKEDLKLLEILKTKKPVFNVYHQPRPDKHVLISSSPIFDDLGTLIGSISIDQDITNVVKLNEKLSLTTTELQKVKQQYNLQEQIEPLAEIKGCSTVLQTTKNLVLKVAKTDATVLIQGESGVGKELFAQGVHEASFRKDQPFVPINCGAIPEALFESEFFGYEKGSFTGANKDGKAGKVEMADGGTLFLDEIGMLPLDMQVKLLRVLQEREVIRIGGNVSKKVDIRIVAATNSDLEQMIKKGQFREDLYYRINVVTLKVPSLRERIEDIPILVNHFAQEYSAKYQKEVPTLFDSAMEMFTNYEWPGNIRELRNVVERMIIFIDHSRITAKEIVNIFPTSTNDYIDKEGLEYEKAHLEKNRIQEALEKTYGNKSAAAKKLGISRVSLYNKIKKYGIFDY
ncbi:sigma-54 interaction domain-containing protein [Psychrobacillus lasiicapitis]|uniref:PAS domain S-box protein n=1 Tax=Psychrobacillus lasiicapitis TaxID=1636719 RepID=A0A544TC88_9BACI|nr:sigma 54-interacting transcriptional regulator [Psychrobacillus lasiicapitis]TQR15090.1 PAS domain S-box protein [Psychrobacillus lasiicapitis]GGA22391.1 sigma-54-dependent Fis family transcriptional regulator [Psychrobacillus lasiicapitis]